MVSNKKPIGNDTDWFTTVLNWSKDHSLSLGWELLVRPVVAALFVVVMAIVALAAITAAVGAITVALLAAITALAAMAVLAPWHAFQSGWNTLAGVTAWLTGSTGAVGSATTAAGTSITRHVHNGKVLVGAPGTEVDAGSHEDNSLHGDEGGNAETK